VRLEQDRPEVVDGIPAEHLAPHSTDTELDRLIQQYAAEQAPIVVNFRELVSWMKYGERATHLIHPYPAKLLPHIPHFFLHNSRLSKPGDLVLDPFCGSGTVLLEAILAGRRATGFDCNPFSALLARVKVRKLDAPTLSRALNRVLRTAPGLAPAVPPIINSAHWYSSRHLRNLGRLRNAILRTSDVSTREFMLVCLSATARKVSNADPRVSVPVKLKIKGGDTNAIHDLAVAKTMARIRKADTFQVFAQLAEANIERAMSLASNPQATGSAVVFECDSRSPVGAAALKTDAPLTNKVQLIITSPPYAGAQKYVRATSLSLGWLGLAAPGELRPLERLTVGREHFSKMEYETLMATGIAHADSLLREIFLTNPLRAHIASTYLSEMRSACVSMSSSLALGGYLVLVIGNNQVCGRQFLTKEYLKEMLLDCGLELRLELMDHIRSRGLMTKRNKTAGLISSEWVVVFQKGST